MPKRKPMDLELADAVITVLGLIVVTFLAVAALVHAVAWFLGAP